MPIDTSGVWVIVAGSATVLAIGVAALRARKYIEDRIQEALSKEDIIGKISLLVKPDMIFDENGSIISDRGASAFLQDKGIQILKEEHPSGPIPTEIHLSFLRNLKTPPLLTPLNPDVTFVWPRRGAAHDWIYELSYSVTSRCREKEFIRHYRLEIL